MINVFVEYLEMAKGNFKMDNDCCFNINSEICFFL